MRLHLTTKGPGFDDGEIVVTDQDNGWLVSTFKTCEVSPEAHEALVSNLVDRFNAAEDIMCLLEAKRARWGGLTRDESAIFKLLHPLILRNALNA